MATLISDDFNRANARPAGGSWSGPIEIISNQARLYGFEAWYAIHSTSLSTANYEVQVELTQDGLTTASAVGLGVVARYQDTNNFYLLWVDAGALSFVLYRVSGGTYTSIDSHTFGSTNADPVTLKLSCNGTAIKGFVNGIEYLSATDGTHTAAGSAGLRGFNAETTSILSHRFDNFLVTDFEEAPAARAAVGRAGLRAQSAGTADVTGPPPTEERFFPSQPTPTGSPESGTAIELGIQFTPKVGMSGFITGVAFYRTLATTTDFTVSLYHWNGSANALVARKTQSSSTSGWQRIDFDTPAAISRDGFAWTATFWSSTGQFARTPNVFVSPGIDTTSLHAYFNGESGAANGAFEVKAAPAATLTPSSFEASSYGVDVLFATTVSARSARGGFGARGQTTGVASVGKFATGHSGARGQSAGTAVSGPPPTEERFFASQPTPTNPPESGTPIELGMTFTPKTGVSGFVNGVAFYRTLATTADFTVSLYHFDPVDLRYELVARKTQSSSLSGWQRIDFDAPAAIAQDAYSWAVTFWSSTGQFARTPNVFVSPGLNTTSLHAYFNGESGASNGAFQTKAALTSDFTPSNFEASSYGVDVLFALSVAPDVRGARGRLGARGQSAGVASVGKFATGHAGMPHGQCAGSKTEAPPPPVERFFPSNPSPTLPPESGTAYELGLMFTPKVGISGFVMGVSFYRTLATTADFTVSLYHYNGTANALVARKTQSSSTAGWQRIDFDAPVPITRDGFAYTVTFWSFTGQFARTPNVFLAPGIADTTSLHAYYDGELGAFNGVFEAKPALTTVLLPNHFEASNYGVDVAFAITIPTGSTGSSRGGLGARAQTSGVAAPLPPGTFPVQGRAGVRAQTTGVHITPVTNRFGNEAVGANGPISALPHSIVSTRAVPPESGSVTTITLYTGSAAFSGSWKGVIIRASDKVILDITPSFPLSGTPGWHTATFAAPVAILEGTVYYIGFLSDTYAVYTYSDEIGADESWFGAALNNPFGSPLAAQPPPTVANGGYPGTSALSVYATFIPGIVDGTRGGLGARGQCVGVKTQIGPVTGAIAATLPKPTIAASGLYQGPMAAPVVGQVGAKSETISRKARVGSFVGRAGASGRPRTVGQVEQIQGAVVGRVGARALSVGKKGRSIGVVGRAGAGGRLVHVRGLLRPLGAHRLGVWANTTYVVAPYEPPVPPPPPIVYNNTGPRFIWVEPLTGIEHELTRQPDLEVIQGITGLHMPPVELTEDQIPGLGFSGGGARLREQIYTPSEVELPLFLHCKDYTTLWRRHQELSSWFRIRRTASGTPVPGVLRCINPNGTERQIQAVYAAGLEGDQGRGTTGPTYRRLAVVLRAPDALWYARDALTLTFALVAGVEFFISPFFPLKLTSGVISTSDSATNPGDDVAWPVWQVVGPGVDPQISNLTTGETLTLSHVVTGGNSITIDTRPGRKTIVDDATGTRLYTALDPGNPSMWPLQPGHNSIQVAMGGASTASRVMLSFTPVYLGP